MIFLSKCESKCKDSNGLKYILGVIVYINQGMSNT